LLAAFGWSIPWLDQARTIVDQSRNEGRRKTADRPARRRKGSTIVTINIDFKELGDYLGDPVITAATVDRMIHHSVILTIQGPSWRLYESRKLNAGK
jgi:hypothetical protein